MNTKITEQQRQSDLDKLIVLAKRSFCEKHYEIFMTYACYAAQDYILTINDKHQKLVLDLRRYMTIRKRCDCGLSRRKLLSFFRQISRFAYDNGWDGKYHYPFIEPICNKVLVLDKKGLMYVIKENTYEASEMSMEFGSPRYIPPGLGIYKASDNRALYKVKSNLSITERISKWIKNLGKK